MTAYTTVSARLNADLKQNAERVLSALGLTHSAAINALYAQIVLQQGIPFELKIPAKQEACVGVSSEMEDAIATIAKKYRVAKVWAFGSRARNEAREDSDIDLLIEKGDLRGIELGGFVDEVEQSLGMRVDVVTTNSVPSQLKADIEKDKVLLYAR